MCMLRGAFVSACRIRLTSLGRGLSSCLDCACTRTGVPDTWACGGAGDATFTISTRGASAARRSTGDTAFCGGTGASDGAVGAAAISARPAPTGVLGVGPHASNEGEGLLAFAFALPFAFAASASTSSRTTRAASRAAPKPGSVRYHTPAGPSTAPVRSWMMRPCA